MKRIGIFAGSSNTAIPYFQSDVERLADLLAENKYQIVYGAGRVGLMGVLSQRIYEHGGVLIGVVPHHLNHPELVFSHCTELIITKDLHERKETMERLSDAFIVLPGGIGTLDEFFNVIASKQLKYHKKPIYLLSLDNFFGFVSNMMDIMYKHKFIREEQLQLYRCVDTPEEIIEDLEANFSKLTS